MRREWGEGSTRWAAGAQAGICSPWLSGTGLQLTGASLNCHCTPKSLRGLARSGCPPSQHTALCLGVWEGEGHPARPGAGTSASVMAAPHHALRVASPVLQMGTLRFRKVR